jgi:hypothetical protein
VGPAKGAFRGRRGEFDDEDKDSITTPSDYQSFTLDSAGNWASFDDNGTSQDRSHDAANQVTDIQGEAAGSTPPTTTPAT